MEAASGEIATICSSVNRPSLRLFAGVEEPSFQKSAVRNSQAGQSGGDQELPALDSIQSSPSLERYGKVYARTLAVGWRPC
jgi:hypothetical protein